MIGKRNSEREKKIEAQIEEGERRYRELSAELDNERLKLSAIIESMDTGVAIADARGKLLSMNSAALKLHGFKSQKEMYEKLSQYTRDFALSYPDGRAMPLDEWPLSRALRGDFFSDCEVLVHSNLSAKSWIWSYSVAPIRNNKGEVVLIAINIRDVSERKKAEEKMNQQALMIASANDAIIGYDLEQKVTFWNKSAEQLYGYKAEEAMGKTGIDLLKPEYTDFAREDLVSHLAKEGHVETESTRRTKDGKALNIDAHVILLRNETSKPIGYVSVDRNITERKRAEEALRKAKQELEERVKKRTEEASKERQRMYNVLETLPAYIVLFNENYHLPFANRIFRERFGESHGKRCFEFLFNRDSPCENCETYKVLKTNEPHRCEWTGPDDRNYDIYDFPFMEADGSKLILEMGIDITERKLAEEKLRSVSMYSRSLLEASLDPLVTISADGKIMDANNATEDVTGCPRQNLIGSDFCDYFTDPERARAGYMKVFTDGFVRDYPLTIQHISGSTTDVLYNATIYKNDKGAIQGVFAAARDVTESKRAEEALRKRDEIISRLSTPLVGIGEGIVMVPVIGILDSSRAKQLTESVLEHIARTNTEIVVMDISGIAAIDTKTANHILQTVQAVKLMGSELVVTGIRPDVASTLVTLGVDLTGITTRGTLHEGLQYAYAKLGFTLVRNPPE
ncbi:MAG: PAS domain S-box protein [Candidatus Bathyarchaeia archaeon]